MTYNVFSGTLNPTQSVSLQSSQKTVKIFSDFFVLVWSEIPEHLPNFLTFRKTVKKMDVMLNDRESTESLPLAASANA